MTRVTLPSRRENISIRIMHRTAAGDGQPYEISFGWHEGRVMECFANARKTGTDLQAMLNDACIVISVLLQHGVRAEELAQMLGENRGEGATSGPPASPLGAIARAAAQIDMENAL